jgi:hypothetical protein
MTIQRTILAPALLTAALLSACDTTQNGSGDSPEIELSYGGIREGDEPARFGDPEVAAEEREARDPAEPQDPARDVEETRRIPGTISVVVAIRYGDLVERGNNGEGAWRFHVVAHGGLIHGVRQLLDEGEDGGLARVSRNELNFGSHVRPGDSDGARLLIEYAPSDDLRDGIVIETEGLGIALTLRQMLDHRSVYRTRQGEVALHAYRFAPDAEVACRSGTIRARVSDLGEDGAGTIRGVVDNNAGERLGHFRGRYGFRQDGSPVLFGKIINNDGVKVARVRGTFERTSEDEVAVRARIQLRSGEAQGALRGVMVNLDGRGGRLEARWAIDCDAAEDTLPRGDDLGPNRDDAELSRPE